MFVKNILDEDFINYKRPSMVIEFPNCSFKCDKEYGKPICQNSSLAAMPSIEIDVSDIAKRYLNNPITEAICCIGLEPFDSLWDVLELIRVLRIKYQCNDDIVIYTGYKEEELSYIIDVLKKLPNIIIKFGRYIPDQKSHYDDVLGVKLASDNQYAKIISCTNYTYEIKSDGSD